MQFLDDSLEKINKIIRVIGCNADYLRISQLIIFGLYRLVWYLCLNIRIDYFLWVNKLNYIFLNILIFLCAFIKTSIDTYVKICLTEASNLGATNRWSPGGCYGDSNE